MTHKVLRRGMLLAAMLATFALPSESQACWFTSCFGHTATYAPAPAPTYAAYVPAPVTACYSPCSTCNTCNSCGTCNTCGYAPQTSYMPVTTYQPVTAYSPVSSGGCCLCPWWGGTTSYKQVTSYVPQTSYMPVTSYAPACTTNYCNSCNNCNYCNTCSTGCSSCSTGGSSCATGGCSSCGTTAATTTFYESAPSTSYQSGASYQPSTNYQPSSSGCSTCGASASAPIYSKAPVTSYSSTTAPTGGNTTYQQGPILPSVQAPLTPVTNGTTQGAQKPIPEAKSDNGAAKQMSDPAPRLLDPRDRTASMPIMRTWSGTVSAHTVSDVRQAAAQAPADDTDADGWHAPRGR